MIGLTLKTIFDLAQLGVTRVTVTKQAADALTGGMKGLYDPNLEVEEWMKDPKALGQLCGIRFFRE